MTVLVAVADDRVSGRVLDVAVKLGQALEEELYVVHLTENEHATAEGRSMRDEVQAELEGRDVEFSVGIEYVDYTGPRQGKTVGKQVVEIASDTDITHVVVGHRSKRLARRLREGDAAFAVADAASVPVTVVPEGLDESVV